MSARDIIDKCLRDSGAEGAYQTDSALAQIKAEIWKALPDEKQWHWKKINPTAKEIEAYLAEGHYAAGFNDCLRKVKEAISKVCE